MSDILPEKNAHIEMSVQFYHNFKLPRKRKIEKIAQTETMEFTIKNSENMDNKIVAEINNRNASEYSYHDQIENHITIFHDEDKGFLAGIKMDAKHGILPAIKYFRYLNLIKYHEVKPEIEDIYNSALYNINLEEELSIGYLPHEIREHLITKNDVQKAIQHALDQMIIYDDYIIIPCDEPKLQSYLYRGYTDQFDYRLEQKIILNDSRISNSAGYVNLLEYNMINIIIDGHQDTTMKQNRRIKKTDKLPLNSDDIKIYNKDKFKFDSRKVHLNKLKNELSKDISGVINWNLSSEKLSESEINFLLQVQKIIRKSGPNITVELYEALERISPIIHTSYFEDLTKTITIERRGYSSSNNPLQSFLNTMESIEFYTKNKFVIENFDEKNIFSVPDAINFNHENNIVENNVVLYKNKASKKMTTKNTNYVYAINSLLDLEKIYQENGIDNFDKDKFINSQKIMIKVSINDIDIPYIIDENMKLISIENNKEYPEHLILAEKFNDVQKANLLMQHNISNEEEISLEGFVI